ncbi:MAG: hypothetical protein GX601_08015 [Anaerolineales bacterium]|nr:hypothetical protein [Anaerolineales bacterium]
MDVMAIENQVELARRHGDTEKLRALAAEQAEMMHRALRTIAGGTQSQMRNWLREHSDMRPETIDRLDSSNLRLWVAHYASSNRLIRA